MDFNFNQNEEIVYSSNPSFSKPKKAKEEVSGSENVPIIEVHRETKKRRGKPVITIQYFPQKKANDFLRELKKNCATGGSNKNGILEIQGDFKEVILDKLTKEGYSSKWTGG